jgi:hypothetical protein
MKKIKTKNTIPPNGSINELDKLLQNFNWKCYLENNKDLVDLIKTKKVALHHFKYYGYKEGRRCTPQYV